MTPVVETTSNAVPRLRGRARHVFRHDVLAILALGLVIGLTCRGYYAMPYTDFAEFVDCGHAWLAGELPPTFKRAPLYPALVVGVGRLLPVEAAEFRVAEWLNALLLPVNGLLVYLIGRAWFGPAARWAAVWFLLLPLGVYCTAHVIVAPMLTCLILLTISAAGRGSGWAYLAAAAAIMTRYDAAGLIPGLLLADLLRRRPLWPTLARAGLAVVPLAAILLLTWLTWEQRSQDHYLASMAARPVFDLWATLLLVVQTCFDPALLRLPPTLADLGPLINGIAFYLPLAAAIMGTVSTVRRRAPAGILALAVVLCYVVVHAAFPVQVDRFGYPPAAIVVLLAGLGVQASAKTLARLAPPRQAVVVILVAIGAVLIAVLVNEARAVATATVGVGRVGGSLVSLGLVALALLWAAPLALRRRRLARAVLLLSVAVLLAVQSGKAAARLGTGQEMRNVVEAARWIRQHTPTESRILSSQPGLTRLYAGRTPAGRFVGFGEIESDTWPAIVDECRRLKITHIIWHDALAAIHGGYYADQMRLARFDPLARPDEAAGVKVEAWFPGQPNVVIVSVPPADEMFDPPPGTRAFRAGPVMARSVPGARQRYPPPTTPWEGGE